jgi:hypothetical protein
MAAALVIVAYVATAALLAFAPGPVLLRAAAVVPIGAHAVWTLRRWALRTTRTAVIGVELSADGRAALIERGGRRREGRVQPASYVGEWLTTFVIRPDGARVSRSTAILPDMLPAENLRQLRVLLRVAGQASTRGPG